MINEWEFVYHPWRKGIFRLKNSWNVIMQTLFLNIKIINEKQNKWNTYTCPPLVDAEPCSNVFFN